MRRWALIEDAMQLAIVIAWGMICFSFSAKAQQFSNLQTLHGHVPFAISRFHLQPLRDFEATNQLNLAISLPLRNEPALGDLIQQIYDPASTNYHHYLTPEQFSSKFGPDEQDYQAVVTFFKTNGMTVTGIYSNRTLVDVCGSAATIEKVFHTTLHVYQHPTESRTFFAPDTDPAVDLNVTIFDVDGLDNFFIPHPAIRHAVPMADRPRIKAGSGSGENGAYMGSDFRAAYAPGVTLNGGGQTVGLFELEGYYPTDISTYESDAGLPKATLSNVAIDGFSGPQTGDTNDIIETSLDIEMVVSMATNLSKVLVYEAPNGGKTSVPDLLSRIASDNLAKQISCSWLLGDSSSYETYYQQMASQGQSFFQASGDDGVFYTQNQNEEQYADDTNITLVGGTTLSTTGPGGAWSSETVWNAYSNGEGAGGSGGGTNFNGYVIPTWQQGISMTVNHGSTTLRNVPDVALVADNVVAEVTNTTYSVEGTSCAAPLWAAFTAMINQQALAQGDAVVGFINPAIYAIGKGANYASDFHDITTGNNTNTTIGYQFFATAGYDLCSGWGTPNGANLINDLAHLTNWTITPTTGFSATGYAGGPFKTNSQAYLISNPSRSSIKWSLINTSSWLNASATNGTIVAGGTTNITISLNAATNTLTPGTNNTTVTFTNATSRLFQNMSFTLQVNEELGLPSPTGFTAYGAEGGPFTIASQTFSLTNFGSVSFNWQVTSLPSWLNLSTFSGTLAGSANSTVTATLNASAYSLTAGTYTGTLTLMDEKTSAIKNRQFSLSIGQSIVTNGGFETGDFTGWTLTLTTNGVGALVDNGTKTGIMPHSGTYFAALGQQYARGYVSQTLPTVANQSYLLSLWFNSPNVTALSQAEQAGVTSNTPNKLIVYWNSTILFGGTNMLPTSGWTNLQFIATAASSNTVLQFGDRDDPWYLGLDDVNVWPIPNPNIRSFAAPMNGNALSFTWNSLTNVAYEVQYLTNLASTNWLNLNTYLANGPTLSVTNFTDTNPSAYYRILRLP